MILILGDTHTEWGNFKTLSQVVSPDDVVIQVGDFGFYNSALDRWDRLFPTGYPCRVLAMDGNHEDYRIVNLYPPDQLHEVRPNLFHVPRGHVMEIEGQLIGFLGGAESVDKEWRVAGSDWFPEEQVTEQNLHALYSNVGERTLDLLVTHCPPQFSILAKWPKLNLKAWNLPDDWVDISSRRVEEAYRKLAPKKLICGHMHVSMMHDNIQWLDINEVVEFSLKEVGVVA